MKVMLYLHSRKRMRRGKIALLKYIHYVTSETHIDVDFKGCPSKDAGLEALQQLY